MLRRVEFVRCVGLEPGEGTVLDGGMGMFFAAIPCRLYSPCSSPDGCHHRGHSGHHWSDLFGDISE
jgi:hypothetical protein